MTTEIKHMPTWQPASSSTAISAHFEPVDTAPSAARRFAKAALLEWGHSGQALEDAALVISELATNAVQHARTAFDVFIEPTTAGAMRVSVRDGSKAPPVVRTPHWTSDSGRGLQVIAAVATRWGIDPSRRGKVVWAELRD